MIILIAGASHTGKTNLAQKLMEKHHFPYLSIDLLKMGLIRSKQTNLTPYEDEKLTDYLWNIVKEIIKTAIENEQDLIVEGCYIPYNWYNSFNKTYLSKIKYLCLIMSTNYINNHFEDIKSYANIIEKRLDDSPLHKDELIKENEIAFKECQKHHLDYILIEDKYNVNVSI